MIAATILLDDGTTRLFRAGLRSPIKECLGCCLLPGSFLSSFRNLLRSPFQRFQVFGMRQARVICCFARDTSLRVA